MDFDVDGDPNWRHHLVPIPFQRQLIAAAHMTDGKSDNPAKTQAVRIDAIDKVTGQLQAFYPHRFRK
jgi:hypothetical protein